MSSKQDAGPSASPDGKLDPEEKPTELWAPAARTLFQQEEPAAGASMTAEGARTPEGDEDDDDELLPRSGEIDRSEPEEAATELMQSAPPGLGVADTVEMTSVEAAAAIAAAEAEAARLLSDTVEVAGEEGEAARRLALEQRLKDPSSTLILDKPALPQLNRECRMCGKKVTSPQPARLRGPADSDRGFRCEKCKNVFCAAHVVRVSNLFESLLSSARFRCQLCLPHRKIKR